jgi:sulfopyruvate decarboxylase TPP-binding subunit
VIRRELAEKQPQVAARHHPLDHRGLPLHGGEPRAARLEIYRKYTGETDMKLAGAAYDALLAMRGWGVNGGMTRKGQDYVAKARGGKRRQVDSARIVDRLPVPGGSAETDRAGCGMSSPTADTVARRIVDVSADCGISLVASLPDGWITSLITQYAGDARFRHVAVNREESAIGLCSGAFFSGIGTFALMGASGFLTCIYAITKINYTYQIPLLIGITLRGRPGDRAKFHQSNGLYLESVIQAIDIPFVPIERPTTFRAWPTAYQHSRTLSRPVVVGFTREVLRGEA